MSNVINERWRNADRLTALQAAAIAHEIEIDSITTAGAWPASVRTLAARIQRELTPDITEVIEHQGRTDAFGQYRQPEPTRKGWYSLAHLRAWLEANTDRQPAVLFGDKPAPAGDGPSRLNGLLALVIAEKAARYKRGGKPNANQIAEAVLEQLDALPEANSYGLSKTKIREFIAAGLAALEK